MEPMDLNTAAAYAMAVEAPVLKDPPTLTTMLPGGLIDDTGILQREVVVRELTGADEEALDAAMRGAGTNPFLFYDTVISRAVVRIGTVSPVSVAIARRLLRGDRDALTLFIRRVTYGDSLEGKVKCPSCGEDNDVVLDLANDIPMRELEDGNKRSFTVDLRNGRSAEVRLVTGDDIYVLGEQKNILLSQANTILLSRCVLSIDGDLLTDHIDGPEYAVKALGAADRETLVSFLAKEQPGPKMEEVSVPCASCGEKIFAPVDVASLLR